MIDFVSAARFDGYLDVSDIPRRKMGLSYPAPDGSQRSFDLYYPETGEGPFPLIISISGGGWYFGHPTSRHLGRLVHCTVARGYALASVACTSSREKKYPYQIQEAKCAVRHLRTHAAELGLDPEFIALWSSSSGAHLSLMAALTQGEARFDVPDAQGSADVAAVAAVYPCCRLGATAEDYHAAGVEPAHLRSGPRCADSIFLGANVEDVPELCRDASPTEHIHPGVPPVMLLHGVKDAVIPYTHSLEFVRHFREVVGMDQIQSCFLPGAGHSDSRFKDDAMCTQVLDFFDRVRRGEPPCLPEKMNVDL